VGRRDTDRRSQELQARRPLRAIPLPGGEGAIKHPERMALSHLLEAFGPEEESALRANSCPRSRRPRYAWCRGRSSVGSIATHLQHGRLFDAVGALLGATREVTYEGQPAMELEAMAEGFAGPADGYAHVVSDGVIGLVRRCELSSPTCAPAEIVRRSRRVSTRPSRRPR